MCYKFTLIVLFLTADAYAQMCPCAFGSKEGEKPFRHELGLNLLSVREEMVNFSSGSGIMNTGFPVGVQYKYHLDKFSLRAAYDYFEDSYRFETGDAANWNHNYGFKSLHEFRLGAEKTLISSPFQVFVAADIVFSNGQYKGISEGYGDWIWWGYKDHYRFSTRLFGVSPAVGVKYRISRRLSCTAEASVSLLWGRSVKDYGPFGNSSEQSLLTNPLRLLSVNYHF